MTTVHITITASNKSTKMYAPLGRGGFKCNERNPTVNKKQLHGRTYVEIRCVTKAGGGGI